MASPTGSAPAARISSAGAIAAASQHCTSSPVQPRPTIRSSSFSTTAGLGRHARQRSSECSPRAAAHQVVARAQASGSRGRDGHIRPVRGSWLSPCHQLQPRQLSSDIPSRWEPNPRPASWQVAAGPGLLDGVVTYVDKQFLPLGLLLAAALGASFPEPGMACSAAGLSKVCTFAIFVLSGLCLKQGEAKQAVSSSGSLLFGVATVLFFTPLAAHVCLSLPLQPEGLRVGLAIFACMPTTLSSGIALTQAVGGNRAMALLVTVCTNVLGVFTMPFMLYWCLGSSVSISPFPLLQSLLQTIMLPLAVGALARALLPGMAKAVDAKKAIITKLQSTFLITVPWMQISSAVSTFSLVRAEALAAVVVVGLVMHAVFVAFTLTAVKALRLGGTQGGAEALGIQRALVLVGSQKTLPVAVTVIASMSPALGPISGLAVVPCIVCHLMQIIADSFLVSHWLRADERRKQLRSAA